MKIQCLRIEYYLNLTALGSPLRQLMAILFLSLKCLGIFFLTPLISHTSIILVKFYPFYLQKIRKNLEVTVLMD